LSAPAEKIVAFESFGRIEQQLRVLVSVLVCDQTPRHGDEPCGVRDGTFIVDDDAAVRQGLVELLVMEGYRTRAYAKGEEAWRAINGGAQPAAIVLDLWLPDMSGREFLERLRASARSAIPVVVVSGSGWMERIDCDANAVFRKPFDISELVRAVDRLAARSGTQSGSRPDLDPSGPAARAVRQRSSE
jgi:CheY-like chemotaxis protein